MHRPAGGWPDPGSRRPPCHSDGRCPPSPVSVVPMLPSLLPLQALDFPLGLSASHSTSPPPLHLCLLSDLRVPRLPGEMISRLQGMGSFTQFPGPSGDSELRSVRILSSKLGPTGVGEESLAPSGALRAGESWPCPGLIAEASGSLGTPTHSPSPPHTQPLSKPAKRVGGWAHSRPWKCGREDGTALGEGRSGLAGQW